jgi:hypothetical protein
MEVISVNAYASATPMQAINNSNNGNGNNQETNFVLRKVEDAKAELSQPGLLMAEMSIKLMSTMKSMRMTEPQAETNQEAPFGIKDPEVYLKPLAEAYHKMQSELNENSELSNKHGKFLDDAFQGLVRMFAEQNTLIAERNERFLVESNIVQEENSNGYLIIDNKFMERFMNQRNEVSTIVATAKKQADIFSEMFLKNYKKHGMEAFAIAINAAFKS